MFKKDKIKCILSSFFCIEAALTISFFIMLLLSGFAFKKTISEFAVFISGGFFYYTFMGTLKKVLALFAPLLCCGLSIILPFKIGIFNIGLTNQFIFSSFGALMFAIKYKFHYLLCILAGAFFGMVIALVPIFLKIYFNVNEVICGILLNFIVLNLVNYVYKVFFIDMVDVGNCFKTYKISNFLPGSVPGSSFSYAFIFAILIALLIYFFLEETIKGFSIKISTNYEVAKYVGIDIKKNMFLVMMLSGALAGMGSSFYYLSGAGEWSVVSHSLPQLPFTAIVAALLSQMNIIGLLAVSLILSFLQPGMSVISQSTFPKEIRIMAIAIIVYAIVFNNEIMKLFSSNIKKNDFKEKNNISSSNDKINNKIENKNDIKKDVFFEEKGEKN